MNSNKTLAVCHLYSCFSLCETTKNLCLFASRLQSAAWHTVLRLDPWLTCSKPFSFTLVPPQDPASLWKPVGPTSGASPLVVWHRLIPQHAPSHSASVTGAFSRSKKKEGCVCQAADWTTPVHRIQSDWTCAVLKRVADLICWKSCYTTELLLDFSLKGKQLFLLISLIPGAQLDSNQAGWLYRKRGRVRIDVKFQGENIFN